MRRVERKLEQPPKISPAVCVRPTDNCSSEDQDLNIVIAELAAYVLLFKNDKLSQSKIATLAAAVCLRLNHYYGEILRRCQQLSASPSRSLSW